MDEAKTIRVMIVDDHDMLREGLGSFLLATDDLLLVGEASSGPEAIELCSRVHPDIILMDLIMPEMTGVETIRIIHQGYPTIQIIALSSFAEDHLVQDAMKAGAKGYLLKNVSANKLAESIRIAASGISVFATEVTPALVSKPKPAKIQDLTPRECDVLRGIIVGDSNNQIAYNLSIGVPTVKTYVRNILAKLNVSSRTEAAAYAVRHRLLDADFE